MADEIRVAVVDHYPLFRKGVVQALCRAKGMTVAAEGTTAESAEQLASKSGIDVLLLEIAVPDSLKAAEKILQARPDIKIVFLAAVEDDVQAAQALRLGTHGYILKGITGKELAKAIKSVHGGERYLTPELAWRLVAQPKSAPAPAQPKSMAKPLLTVREQQVLDHTSQGLTNQEIASMLGLGISTIKYYKTHLFRKMGIRNRLEAIVTINRDKAIKPS